MPSKIGYKWGDKRQNKVKKNLEESKMSDRDRIKNEFEKKFENEFEKKFENEFENKFENEFKTNFK